MGTPASYLINRSCSDTSKIGKIIFGGAMMGTAAVNLDAPVTKLTSGILLLNDRDAVKPAETACIRCGKCVDVCPMGLRPFAIASAVKTMTNSTSCAAFMPLTVLNAVPARLPVRPKSRCWITASSEKWNFVNKQGHNYVKNINCPAS